MVWGWRIVMFQSSGFYSAAAMAFVNAIRTCPKPFGNTQSCRISDVLRASKIPRASEMLRQPYQALLAADVWPNQASELHSVLRRSLLVLGTSAVWWGV